MIKEFLEKNKNLKIIVVILMIIIGGLFNEYQNMKDLAYESLDNVVKDFITCIKDINEDVMEMICLEDKDNLKDYNFKNTNAIYNLEILRYYISKAMNMPSNNKYIDCLYFEALHNINNIVSDGYLSEEEKSYLILVHNYNDELIETYNGVLSKYSSNKYSDTQNSIRKIYIEFTQKANKIAEDKKYKNIGEMKFDVKEDKNEKINNISIQQAKNISNKMIKKLFPNAEDLANDDGIKTAYLDDSSFKYNLISHIPNKYAHCVKLNINVSFDKTEGFMDINVDFPHDGKIQNDKTIDEKAKEVVNKVVNDNYVISKKHKNYDEDNKLQDINYTFVRKVDNIYDESKSVDLNINKYGDLTYINIPSYISNYKSEEIVSPKLSQEDIVKKIKNAKIKNCKLINEGTDMIYKVHAYFNDIGYYIEFNANTGEKERIYKDDVDYDI